MNDGDCLEIRNIIYGDVDGPINYDNSQDDDPTIKEDGFTLIYSLSQSFET